MCSSDLSMTHTARQRAKSDTAPDMRKFQPKKWQIFPAALVITLPSTIISSCITAFLFGGITSSGSTVLVQLLAKTPLGMVGSCFAVQFITDYIDRVLCIAVAAVLITALRKSMKAVSYTHLVFSLG